MSTGMATENEISEALETARIGGCNSLLLFHCISSYPAPIEQANLKQILNLKRTFGISIGLSDHTIGNTAAIASIALGACAIEKHFTISRDEKSPDSNFSVEPGELKELVKDTKNAWEALGNEGFNRPEAELGSVTFRRSIYFISDIKSGNKIKKSDIRRIRPGFGLPPKYFDKLIGKTLIKDVKRGDAVNWDMILENKDC
jgi:N-acetylneuraminate synthase